SGEFDHGFQIDQWRQIRISLLAPMTFRSRGGGAATGHELRKVGTRHERYDLSQSLLRHLAQYAGYDPPKRRGAGNHRIPEDPVGSSQAARTGQGDGNFGSRAAAREGHAL